MLYVFWSLSSVVAFAFMVSTMTDSPAGAIFAGFGIYVFSQILDGIIVARFDPLRPPHPLLRRVGQRSSGPGRIDEFATGQLEGWTSDMTRGVLLPIAYVLVFLGIAWWHFRRKDVLS